MAGPTVESARKSLNLEVSDSNVGCFMNLHCGHNNPFTREEREQLKGILAKATNGSSVGTPVV